METIFMIHGMWVGSWCFDRYKAFFEGKGYRVVAPTLPYHDTDPNGPPHPMVGTASLQEYSAFLEGEIRKLDAPPIVMGYSMGGLLAQILAARGLGKAHILLMPAPPAGVFALRPSVVWSFMEGLTHWAFWRKPFKPSFGKTVYAMLHLTAPEDQKKFYERMVYESGWASAQIGFWPFDFSKGAYVDETKVSQPMLVISGSEDRITPAAVVRKVAAKYAHVAEHREFPGMAHNVMGEAGWEDVAWAVHDWLKTKNL